MVARGNPNILKVGRRSAVSTARFAKNVDGCTVTHLRNDECLYHGNAQQVRPNVTRVARDPGLYRGSFPYPMNIAPLPHDRIGVRRRNRVVRPSMPY